MEPIRLELESRLAVEPAQAWRWATSLKGISAELSPLLRMSAPRGVQGIGDMLVTPGRPLFRSRIYLFGFLPIDRSDLTLMRLDEGQGFIEQSPMMSMSLWRHERRIARTAGGCTVTDSLVFEPRWARRLVAWFIGRVFAHRHAVMRKEMGATRPWRSLG